MPTSLMWFRQDLRLADNPALKAAMQRGAVVPIYIDDAEDAAPWAPGAASRWWLHQSLQELERSLRSHGSHLILRRGAPLAQLRELCAECGADAVFWNRRYEPASIASDSTTKQQLRDDGLVVESFNGALLIEPWDIANQSGKPFQVFTPFWRAALRQLNVPPPLPTPRQLPAPESWPRSLALTELQLLPAIRWYVGMERAWQPGEAGAQARLHGFLDTQLRGYADLRDRPDRDGTSRLSPHLHFGEISPAQIWQTMADSEQRRGVPAVEWQQHKFLAELAWREFSHHLLYHFPHIPDAPLRSEFERFPWRDDPAALAAWQRGRTGVPLVDAGMRELWATGWMHNRVRMVVASFLVKNLRLRWQLGARWFWDTLVDADLANNTQGWQWTAGCGADAAPYFRVFNPVSQGRKFDARGEYVRRWVPELAALPVEHVHAPWQAPPEILRAAGVELGATYPQPIVDLQASRAAALDAFKQMRAEP